MDIDILNRRPIVIQRHLRKSVESDRQVFVVRIMPAVSEFDDTLGMLWPGGRQVDGHSAMTDASTKRSDPSTYAIFLVYRHTVLVTPKPKHRARKEFS